MLESHPPNPSLTERSRTVVLAFYNEALVGRSPRAAFLRFMAPNFIEHKPDVEEGTRAKAAELLESIMSELPDATWEIVRAIAEGNLVAVHARFTPARGAPAYAIVDIFRVEQELIIEHWDVVAGPPREQRNPNARF